MKARLHAGRLLYRASQFREALGATPRSADLDLAASLLTAPQLDLFQKMQPSEQAHSLRVLQALVAAGERDTDLLTAALLHDAGKSLYPLRAWERVLIVGVSALCPACLARWGSVAGEGDKREFGWRRPFVVARQHPQWGAELAVQAGASSRAAALIWRHQDRLPSPGSGALSMPETNEDRLLRALQAVDDNS